MPMPRPGTKKPLSVVNMAREPTQEEEEGQPQCGRGEGARRPRAQRKGPRVCLPLLERAVSVKSCGLWALSVRATGEKQE